MYEKGDYVIKPFKGVCKIEEILYPDFPGLDRGKLYYLLVPQDDPKGRIYVPVDMEEKSIRKAMTADEAHLLIRKMPEIEEILISSDKLREKTYRDAIAKCDPVELVAIIKTMYVRRQQRFEQGKKSTMMDEHYFKTAENYLYSELGIALDKSSEEIEQLIRGYMDEAAG